MDTQRSPLPAVAKSPVEEAQIIHEANLMNFTDAIGEMMNQKKLTRAEWKNKDTYCLMRDNCLTIHTDTFHSWVISAGDIMGEDWMVV